MLANNMDTGSQALAIKLARRKLCGNRYNHWEEKCWSNFPSVLKKRIAQAQRCITVYREARYFFVTAKECDRNSAFNF
jgi:hypothetical protein